MILAMGSVMRLRAAVAARVGRRGSIPEDRRVVVRKIESDARRAAPVLEVVGVSIALAGFLGGLSQGEADLAIDLGCRG